MSNLDLFDSAVSQPAQQVQQPAAQKGMVPQQSQPTGEDAVDDTYEDVDMFKIDFDPEQFKHIALDSDEPAFEEVIGARTQAGGKEGQPSEMDKPMTPQEQARYEYWQSRADKERNARLELEQQLKAVQEIMPYVQILKERPEILGVLAGQQANMAQQPQRPTPPKPPQKPADYDPYAALNDPDSDSYRWREAMEQYQLQYADYLQNRLQALEQEREEERQRQAFLAQQQQAMQEWRKDLMQNYKFTPQMADMFVQEMYSPESLTKENLVKLFLINHPEFVQPQRNTAPQYGTEVRRPAGGPPTIAVAPAKPPEQKSPSEAFSEGLLSISRKVDY